MPKPLLPKGRPQQRSFVRVAVARLPAAVWLCQPRIVTCHDARILNLSGDGVLLELDIRGLALGAEVRIVFTLPKTPRLSLSGRIMRLDAPEENAPASRRTCGARFVFARETERDRLVGWVFDSLAEQRRHVLAQPVLELAELPPEGVAAEPAVAASGVAPVGEASTEPLPELTQTKVMAMPPGVLGAVASRGRPKTG
jgi:hypothetical protein